jgi:ATP-dependent RNA helicase DeaD
MTTNTSFSELGLPDNILSALIALEYQQPTPVQAESIPILLNGTDLLAQAQTGTGKTAAFALPTLASLKTKQKNCQILVLTPTRELAIQVANAYKDYAQHSKDVRIATIYGGQSYSIQLKELKAGANIVVGTPGRIMDHLRRGTLNIKALQTVVLDEADEMLKMGFIDDIEWILEKIEQPHQTALFSATLPTSIKNIANKYLHKPEKVNIKVEHNTKENITQHYMFVNNKEKVLVIQRYLETQQFDGVIIFTKTKSNSDEVAKQLISAGYNAAALNGDMQQNLRKKVIESVQQNKLDIIVATDVAARGIDLERITHVVNYDGPNNIDSYTHRIGRTGRAGREGQAVLFVTANDRRLLKDIKQAYPNITEIQPPSNAEVANIRQQQLSEKIIGIVQKSKKIAGYQQILAELIDHTECSLEEVASALLYLHDAKNPIAKLPEEFKKTKQADKKPKRAAEFKRKKTNAKPNKSKTKEKSKKFKTNTKPSKKR